MARVWMAADRIFVRLNSEERAVLSQLPVLVGGVGSDEDDPAAGRMTPNAYADDAEAAARWIADRFKARTGVYWARKILAAFAC